MPEKGIPMDRDEDEDKFDEARYPTPTKVRQRKYSKVQLYLTNESFFYA